MPWLKHRLLRFYCVNEISLQIQKCKEKIIYHNEKHELTAQTHLILTLTLWTSCFQNKESCLDKLEAPPCRPFPYCNISLSSSQRFTGFYYCSVTKSWLCKSQTPATSRTAARQASLSFTISLSLLKLTSIELVIPSNHPILCAPFSSCPQSLPASGSFPKSQLFTLGSQSI